ncbi:MAG: replication initiator protein WhiP [Acidilobus sp.]|nr:replication initiator protein WhiP [Acidilobus sp.]
MENALRGRGGPRSRLVDAILVLLLSRPMRSSEIGEVLGKEAKYISSYLSYWKDRGYVDYDLGLWYLTPKGEEYARQIAERETDERFNEFVALAHRIASRLSQTRNNKAKALRADVTDESQLFIAELTERSDRKQQGNRASVAACVLQSLKDRLTDEETEVVMEMLSHYTMYGVTYMYMDQLAERLKADYEWLIRRVRDLQSKGIVYIYTDPRLGIRVGFSKAAKEVLATCGHGR